MPNAKGVLVSRSVDFYTASAVGVHRLETTWAYGVCVITETVAELTHVRCYQYACTILHEAQPYTGFKKKLLLGSVPQLTVDHVGHGSCTVLASIAHQNSARYVDTFWWRISLQMVRTVP